MVNFYSKSSISGVLGGAPAFSALINFCSRPRIGFVLCDVKSFFIRSLAHLACWADIAWTMLLIFWTRQWKSMTKRKEARVANFD